VSKKHKFDLKTLVHDGLIKDGQVLFFVSDPKKTCKVQKQPNGEFKVVVEATKETTTVHAFAQNCLGQEPPNHAAMWLRTEQGKTLYELWHQNDLADAA
jgi:hypothetical protein